MTDLTQKSCVPCNGDVPPLKGEALLPLMDQLEEAWEALNEHHLQRSYRFVNFAQALAFVNQVGELAEKEGHHPDILLGYGRVQLVLFTHAVNGLTESDFILAAKLDALNVQEAEGCC